MKHQTSILFLSLTFLLVNVGNTTAQQKHEYVDLDLPSGTLWATCNVGATNPWDYGDYFAWGETTKKTTYSCSNYKYSKLDDNDWYFTKYCDEFGKGYNGYSDTLSSLEKNDDVAYLKWGRDWCMPTQDQLNELFHNCTYEWTINYQGKGVAGLIFYSEWNDNTIFLPAAGYKYSDGTNDDLGKFGYYWSSDCIFDVASSLDFGPQGVRPGTSSSDRYLGFTVRPVRCEKQHSMFDDLDEDDSFLDEDNKGGNTIAQQNDEYVDLSFLYDDNKSGNTIAQQNDEYVDLGLPSGTLWATCNVGATVPEDYGDYFAWGETTTKSIYSKSNYKYANGTNDKFIKYCSQSSYGDNGFTDSRRTLENNDDVAYQNCGNDWGMPTGRQLQELTQHCIWEWTTRNGKNGYNVKGSNGNSIFLPAAGCRFDTSVYDVGNRGCYWSSSLDVSDPNNAFILFFSGIYDEYYPDEAAIRSNGCPVRPVRSKK